MRITELERSTFMANVIMRGRSIYDESEYYLRLGGVYNSIREWITCKIGEVVDIDSLHKEFVSKFSHDQIYAVIRNSVPEASFVGYDGYIEIIHDVRIFRLCFSFNYYAITKNRHLILGHLNSDDYEIFEKAHGGEGKRGASKLYKVQLENPSERINVYAEDIEELYKILRTEYKRRHIVDVIHGGKSVSNKYVPKYKTIIITMKHGISTINIKATLETNERGVITIECVNKYIEENYSNGKYTLVKYKIYKRYEGLYSSGVKNCVTSRSSNVNKNMKFGRVNYKVGF